ncbi:hypothetical protein Q8A73_009495 [Channa argus]|nr:hypothetical protein Q8A73_009495 [Channa argus]
MCFFASVGEDTRLYLNSAVSHHETSTGFRLPPPLEQMTIDRYAVAELSGNRAPGALTTPFGCNCVRPRKAPSSSERPIKSLLTAWSAALLRSPSILLQDSIHSGPENPSNPSLLSATPNPVLSTTPSCRGLFEEGRDVPHIVLNGEKCRVQLHLQNQHLTTAMLQVFILGPGFCGHILSGFCSPARLSSKISAHNLFRSVWMLCCSICGEEVLGWWWLNLNNSSPC